MLMSKKRFIREAVKTGFQQTESEDACLHLSRLEADGQTSSMVCYSILPGIDLIYNSFNGKQGAEEQYPSYGKKVIELNFCLQGRFGCLLDGKRSYLGEGEIEAHFWGLPKSEAEFPLGIYKGISLLIDTQECTKKLPELFPEIKIQLNTLLSALKQYQGAVKIKGTSDLIKLFHSMYQVQPALQEFYLRLKVLELLVLIQAIQPDECCPQKYFRKRDFDKIKLIHQEILANLDKHYSLEYLAEKYSIGRTTLQRCFREIYGLPYYSFVKKKKMHQAVHFLDAGRMNITEIASKLGYGNVSKFSAAFRSVHGYNPNEYRKTGV